MEPASLSPRQKQLINELFNDLSGDFQDRFKQAQAIRDALLIAMAAHLQSSMNDYLASHPKDTGEDIREMAQNLNSQLTDLNLAIKCPKTGRPAILAVDSIQRGDGRLFRLRTETKDERGVKARVMINHAEPLSFELMLKPPRYESFAKVHQPDSSRGRE